MKFAINHSYKFKPGSGFIVGFLSGFMQASMIMCVEIVNILSILSYQDTMNVVIIFLALAIVADFDSFFYEALGENRDKDLIVNENGKYDELLFTIRRTSSNSAKARIEENKLDDPALHYLRNEIYSEASGKQWKLDGVKKDEDAYIWANFSERSCINKVCAGVYRLYRSIYVSFWYYFFPFSVLFGTYSIPWLFGIAIAKDNQIQIDPELKNI